MDSVNGDASARHLLGRLELVARRVRAACEGRRAADPDPLDRFRGLHISPSHVERLLDPAAGAPPPDEEAGVLLARVEEEADRAEAAGAELRLRHLQRAFDLGGLELELLLVALAPDLEARFEPLYGYLQDDVTRRRAGIGLALELCGADPAGLAGRRLLGLEASLCAARLLLVEEPERPFLTRSLRVPDRIAAFLLGDDAPEPAIAPLLDDCEPAVTADVAGLSRWLGLEPGLAYLRETRGGDAGPLAVAALGAAGLAALIVDLHRLRADDDPAQVASLLVREAGLRDAALVAGPIEALASRGRAAVQAIAERPVRLILFGTLGWDPEWARTVPYCVEVPPTPAEEREDVWRTALAGGTAPGLDPAAETAPFRLTADQVRRAARAARQLAAADGRPVAAADLRAGARAQNGAGLERLARRIEPMVALGDLVLPAPVLEQLTEITVRARHRDLVLGRWGMAGAASRRRGLTALFAGASGTGKTMAAEAVAGEMGLDLYVVDLATVVDKYVGETEKNLDRIFAEAERVNGVLLFDEADALFGKRSDVSDAHDRYANIEVAYLLQRMELFEGIAVLATNLRSNLDEAFARRLDALIDFPDPEEEDRLRLWERCLGTEAPRSEDVDLAFFARAFRLSGGNIRNIVLTAAYAAAQDDGPIGMTHLVLATQREYRKLGRMVVESEFGPWLEVLGRR
ncbi:MAG TPA: ATP-binding protein [Candidatus Dormibacteraeota bacterium]|nr:ATP-binding protein [Candidatus Dormibacteraeota bacterium]